MEGLSLEGSGWLVGKVVESTGGPPVSALPRSNPVRPPFAIRLELPPALSALWSRDVGSKPDPAAQPRAVLAVDEGIAGDLEHETTTVGLVAASSAS